MSIERTQRLESVLLSFSPPSVGAHVTIYNGLSENGIDIPGSGHLTVLPVGNVANADFQGLISEHHQLALSELDAARQREADLTEACETLRLEIEALKHMAAGADQ